ncbi:MAG TPA: biosynthetic-type acetolactate synthase large subunit [Vicinamibacteria bacterium]|nr:biosynthetic-type acetolactate synthase large subunit [Vicinamibacteria bacterium]
MLRTGAQIVWDVLGQEGVRCVFGYPGGAILPIYDALLGSSIHHVLVRHEQGAAHMADGYARASGEVGVAMATSGPGATNLVTGIATAMLDSSSVVFITGQVSSRVIGTDAFQETDITGVTLPITKHNFLVTRTEDVGPTLRKAFHIARTGRPGPVLVDITKDAQQGTLDYEPDEAPVELPERSPQDTLTRDALDEAAGLVSSAKRPLVLAGRGVMLAGATDLLQDFVERTRIPVAMTLLGIGGFPATHALNLGMMGMHGEAWVNRAIQSADVLLAIGMRFDDRVTGDPTKFATSAKKIHLEIDRSEINKVIRVDVPLVGDLRETLSQLAPRISTTDLSPWHSFIEDLKGDTAVRDIQTLPDSGHLYAAHVISDLWNLTEGQALVVTDVGQHQMWEAQYYKHDYPRKLITSGGLGTMGFALPAALGAKFAKPEEEVWVIVGDGGFQMTAAELSTCAQENMKLNVAVINNGYLGMVRQWQEFFYDKRYAATPMSNPDFVKLADAHGLPGFRVEKRSEIAEAVSRARALRETAVIDFRVEREDTVYPMVAPGKTIEDMIRRPVPVLE